MTEKDELFIERNSVVLDFASLNKLILKDLTKADNVQRIGQYDREQVKGFLGTPSRSERQLREVSITVYNNSTHYKRLINYFANMLTLDYIVAPNSNNVMVKGGAKSLSSAYQKVVNFLDVMNIKHEYGKLINIALREDVAYGYKHFAKDSFFIQTLPPDYCKISSIEDGCFNFAFDFGYFRSNPEKIDFFPPEFKSKFNKYSKDSKLQWQELDSANTVCIKFNEDLEYSIPPFVGILLDVFDISEYKALKKAKEKIGNYKLLVQEIPLRDGDDNNDFRITLDVAQQFHAKISSALPDEVGVATTPMKVTGIDFDRDKAGSDKVAEAENRLYSGAGVSQLLFNSESAGAIGLTQSIIADAGIMFRVLRQVERNINRDCKSLAGNKFKAVFPDLTIYNRDDMFDKYLQAGQFGVPTKTLIGASLGLSPSDFVNLSVLENDVLQLQDKFMYPLISSHTATDATGGQGGAPTKKDSKLTTEGAKTRQGDKNNR